MSTPNASDLLLRIAAELGLSVDRGDVPPRALPVAWFVRSLGSGVDADAVRSALLAHVAGGRLRANRIGAASDLRDPASKLELTPAGLAAARALRLDVGLPRAGVVDRVVVDLGEAFADGTFAPRVVEPTDWTPLHGAVLVLALHRPVWALQVLALLVKTFAAGGRLDLGGESFGKAGPTPAALRKRIAPLVDAMPGLSFGKDGARATLCADGPLPSLACTSAGRDVSVDELRETLDDAFGLAHVQPLASVARVGRMRGASAESDGDGDEAEEPELDADQD
jgi:hypothetical protein